MALTIFLLGQFRLEVGQQVVTLSSRPAQSLLAYLALHAGMAQRRERLAGLLWPDASEDNARAYLRQALWRVRKAFSEAGLVPEDVLQISDLSLALDPHANYWLDADAFLATPPTAPWPDLAAAIALYRGELLPGSYDEWVIVERDRLHAAYQQRMDALLRGLMKVNAWDEVLHWAEEWIRLDYGPEPAYRALMCAFAASGNTTMVKATYRRCVEALERELAVQPGAATQRLYARLQQGDMPSPESSSNQVEPAKRPAFLTGEAARPHMSPLFVGRARELARMQHFLALAEHGQGQMVLVSGEAGSGKTALVQAFARQAVANLPDIIVASGNCNAQTGIGDPYLPFREILELLTGNVEAQWAAGAITQAYARRLWDLLPYSAAALLQMGPDLIDTFVAGPPLLERLRAAGLVSEQERLAELLSRRSAGGSFRRPEQSDLFEQYTRFLHLLARQSSLILILDDLQWADLGSISLLFHLARSLAGAPVLIIGAFRPEELAIFPGQERHPFQPVLHELQRQFGDIIVDLDRTEGRVFIGALLDSEPNKLDQSFRGMLYRQTRGHPLFTLELLRGLQERGDLLHDENGCWIAGEKLNWDRLPVRTEAIVAERIGRLAAPLRAALRVASVEGELFTAEVVARIQEMDEREILNSLSRELDRKHQLVRAHSITRKAGRLISTYRFRHLQIQKYLYSTLDEVERVYLHEQVGETLEALYGDGEADVALAIPLAHHFREAGITLKAVHYLHLAGQRALRLAAYREALDHLAPALDLLQSLPDSKGTRQIERDLQLAIGAAWMGTGTPSTEMETAFERARDLSRRLGETGALSRALGGLVILHYVNARFEQARTLAEETLTLAEQARDPLLVMIGRWLLGFVLYSQGEYEPAHELLESALDAYEPAQHHQQLVTIRGVDAGASAMAYDACCLWALGYPELARARRHEAIWLAYELDHAFTIADVLCYAGCTLDLLAGDGEALLEDAQAFVSLAREKGLAGWQKMANCFYGEGLALCGDARAGITLIQQSLAAKVAASELLNLPGKYATLARAWMQLRRLQKAKGALASAFQYLEESGESSWACDLYCTQGELWWAEGDLDAATGAYTQALDAARRQKAKALELRAATGLARLKLAQGDGQAARRLLQPVADWFEPGAHTPDLARARALLAELPYNS